MKARTPSAASSVRGHRRQAGPGDGRAHRRNSDPRPRRRHRVPTGSSPGSWRRVARREHLLPRRDDRERQPSRLLRATLASSASISRPVIISSSTARRGMHRISTAPIIIGHKPDVDLGHAEFARSVGGNDDVARRRQSKASGECMTVDPGDGRLPHAPHETEAPRRKRRGRGALSIGLSKKSPGEIPSGREDPVACTGDDNNPHGRDRPQRRRAHHRNFSITASDSGLRRSGSSMTSQAAGPRTS